MPKLEILFRTQEQIVRLFCMTSGELPVGHSPQVANKSKLERRSKKTLRNLGPFRTISDRFGPSRTEINLRPVLDELRHTFSKI